MNEGDVEHRTISGGRRLNEPSSLSYFYAHVGWAYGT